MTNTAQRLLQEALLLSPVERAKLIGELYRSLDTRQDSTRVDAVWADEAESRIDAYEAGELEADSVEGAFERIGT